MNEKPSFEVDFRFEHPFDSFNDFFGSGGGGRFQFKFNGGGGGGGRDGGPGRTIFHKQTITSKAYYKTILPNSEKQVSDIVMSGFFV